MECTCVRCGKKFEAKRKTAACPECHTAVCVICGKKFDLQFPWTQQTCSPKCRGEYRKRTGISKIVRDKAQKTLKARYGVENPYLLQYFTRKCKLCGKEFTTTSSRKIYCDDIHYGPCPVCGKPTVIRDPQIGPQACSEKCRQLRIERTCMEKYGYKCSVNSEYGRKKGEETCIRKYGVPRYSMTDDFKSKFKQIMLSKYGVEHPLQNNEIKSRFLATNIIRYGGKSPQCSEYVREKSINTFQKRYRGIGFASPDTSKKIKETTIDKFGCYPAAKSDEVKQRIAKTFIEKYGSPSWASSKFASEHKISNPDNVENYLKFKDDPKKFILENFIDKPTVNEICEITGVTDTTVYDILIEKDIRHLADFKSSNIEKHIYKFLLNFFSPEQIKRNSRKVISPLEVDFYIPDKKLAIECNPTITHNSSFSDPWGQERKAPNYHKLKSDMCQAKGIFLFHIFGYEWANRREIILSMLQNLIGATSYKEYARNTSIRSVSSSEACSFLQNNHRQGATNASINLGLYNKQNELVSLMCFNKIRKNIGRTCNDSENTYELSRFCNKINMSIVGGASKLLSWFTRNVQFDKIVSFSDKSHTKGNLYSKLGFEKVTESQPGYVWVNLDDDSYMTRTKCQKHNLCKVFDDVSESFIKDNTEKEIMMSHGYCQVFDSGTIRWELR